MNSLIRKVVVSTAVAALTLHPVLAQAQTAIGNANKVVAAVQGVLQSNTRTLVVRDQVFSNEVVNTGANSAARLVFRDNTMLSVGANSSVTLDNFVFDADASKSQVAVSVSKGVMRFVTGNLAKERYSIRTPTAVIGIRGTTLVVAVALNGATSVSVIEGVATVTAAGATSTVGAGFTSTVSSAGVPPTPPAASPPPSPQVQAMNSSLGPEPGGQTGTQASGTGPGGLSTGAIAGAAAAAALAIAVAAAASDSDSVSTTDASSSTGTSTTSGE